MKKSEKAYQDADKAYAAAREQDRQERVAALTSRIDAVRAHVKDLDLDSACALGSCNSDLHCLEAWLKRFGDRVK